MKVVLALIAFLYAFALQGQAYSGYKSQETPCQTVEWLRNSTNINAVSGGGLQKTSAANSLNAGGVCSQYLRNAGDTFTFQVSAVGGYVGLSYDPDLNTNNTTINFAWNITALTTAQAVQSGVVAATVTTLNLSSGQHLRIRLDNANRVVFEYETAAATGIYTVLFTSTAPIGGNLYPDAALSVAGSLISNATICKQ